MPSQINLFTYPGPLRPTRLRKITSKRCLNCQTNIPPGHNFCWPCKDPQGYHVRLEAAHVAARQRCLEAYPVCNHCGRRLSDAQVASGQTAHDKGTDFFGCAMPEGWVN